MLFGISRGYPDGFEDFFPASARTAALGNCGTALTGAEGVSYNPGSIAYILSPEILAFYSPLYLGGGASYLSYAHNFSNVVSAGMSFFNYSSGDIEKLSDLGQNEGSYSFRSTFFCATVGKKMEAYDAGLGVAFKVINRTAHTYEDSALGADLGTYKSVKLPDFKIAKSNKLHLGLAYKNFIVPSIRLFADTERFPQVLSAGLRLDGMEGRAGIFMDLNIAERYGARVACGLEIMPYYGLKARLGYDGYLTAGFGMQLKNISFEYSLSPKDLSLLHFISLKYRFAPPLTIEEEKVEKVKNSVEKFSQAITRIENQQYDVARQELEIAHSMDPENYSIERLLKNVDRTMKNIEADRIFEEGLTYYSKMNYETAEERFARTLELNPEHRMAKTIRPVNRTYLYLAQGEILKAKEELLKAVEEFPENEQLKGILSRVRLLEKY